MPAASRGDAFGSYHPAVVFFVLACAIGLSVLIIHPAFLVVSVACATAYLLTLRGREALGLIGGMLPLFLLVSAINPLFNTLGETVLLTYGGGRPYTLEALCYGMATAAMLVSVLLWFASFGTVMTGDKIMHLFGSMLPSAALVFTMVLGLVPHYGAKARQIVTARRCMGKAGGKGVRSGVREGAAVLGSLSSWAFEEAVTLADSMRSRGFGTGARSSYRAYEWTVRDGLLLALALALALAVGAGMLSGALEVAFIPAVSVGFSAPLFGPSLAAFAALLLLPTAANVREGIAWRISLSRA